MARLQAESRGMASAGALRAAEDTILSEACPEVATQLQGKRCLAMAVGSFRIAPNFWGYIEEETMGNSLCTSFVANNSGDAVLLCASADGATWTGNLDTNQSSKFAPSLAVFNNRLYLAFIANNSGNG